MKAYALLRLPGKDIPLTTKEAYIGRDPSDLETDLVKAFLTSNDIPQFAKQSLPPKQS
jgi:hypothetical protein